MGASGAPCPPAANRPRACRRRRRCRSRARAAPRRRVAPSWRAPARAAPYGRDSRRRRSAAVDPVAARKRFTASAFRRVRSRSKSRSRPGRSRAWTKDLAWAERARSRILSSDGYGKAAAGPVQIAFAVGLDQRHVDAVHRRAAHEADRAQHLAHPPLPVHIPTPPGNGAARDCIPATWPNTNPISSTLDERGFIHQCSDFAGLDALAAKGEAIGYIGFDCTAPSLHVGNMIVIMMLHWLQQTGNKPIVLMGGGTTRVGDPSGKDETRKILLASSRSRPTRPACSGPSPSFMTFGDRQDRRHDARQRRVADASSTTSSSCATSAATSPSTAC